MSGHSKWAKEKHGKVDRDRQKGNLFGKLSRDITMAVINGGGLADPDQNALLRVAVEKARQNNLPKENIERAISRASGPDKANIKDVTYEAFGPGGAALLILATTDNPNRTHSEIKITLDKTGGKLAGQGAVSYMFQGETPLFTMPVDDATAQILRNLIDSLEELDDVDTVYTNATI